MVLILDHFIHFYVILLFCVIIRDICQIPEPYDWLAAILFSLNQCPSQIYLACFLALEASSTSLIWFKRENKSTPILYTLIS